MPPKKKAKGSVRATSTPVADEDTVMPDVESSPAKPTHDILKDPWTDEQETSLFKGIIKWKPAGMHKHFRMIALEGHMRNHGYNRETEIHTTMPGIWAKLKTLYDLDTIDERENFFGEEDASTFLEFTLPDEDFGEETFMRGKRSPSEAPSSPPRLGGSPSPEAPSIKKGGRRRKREGTVEDTDDARSSPAHSIAKTTARRGRAGTRTGIVKGESSSRAPSTQEATEEEVDEETEEVDEEEEEVVEEDGTPSPKPPKGKRKTEAPVTRKSKRTR